MRSVAYSTYTLIRQDLHSTETIKRVRRSKSRRVSLAVGRAVERTVTLYVYGLWGKLLVKTRQCGGGGGIMLAARSTRHVLAESEAFGDGLG
jgi:hypothetical protein